MKAGANLNALDIYRATPLTYLVCNIDPVNPFFEEGQVTSQLDQKSFVRYFHGLLTAYLKVLEDAGVDLADYGRQEHDLFLEKRTKKSLWLGQEDLWHDDFKYGRSPDDWRFFFDECFTDLADESAGDFWALIEAEERLNSQLNEIPGAWVDG